MKKQADGRAAWAATNQVSATVEGSLVWDDANDSIAYCDGTNWVALDGGSGTDNLGDHEATQNIALGSHYLSGDGGNEGVFVAADGNVGLGTSQPGAPLHISSEVSWAAAARISNFSDSAILQIWSANGTKAAPTSKTSGQVIGNIGFAGFGTSESGFFHNSVALKAIAEENFTDSAKGGAFTISTSPVGQAAVAERVRIASDGKVGIGTSSPSQTLHVNGTALADGWNVPSDRRLKTDVLELTNAIELLNFLNGYSFNYIEDSRPSVGLMAQEVEAVFPSAVTTNPDSGLKDVDYNQLIAPLVEAVQALSAQNQRLEEEIQHIYLKLDAMKQRPEGTDVELN